VSLARPSTVCPVLAHTPVAAELAMLMQAKGLPAVLDQCLHLGPGLLRLRLQLEFLFQLQ